MGRLEILFSQKKKPLRIKKSYNVCLTPYTTDKFKFDYVQNLKSFHTFAHTEKKAASTEDINGTFLSNYGRKVIFTSVAFVLLAVVLDADLYQRRDVLICDRGWKYKRRSVDFEKVPLRCINILWIRKIEAGIIFFVNFETHPQMAISY